MPIFRAVDADAELAQGDLLNDLEFHVSKLGAEKGPSKQNGLWLGLVVSRDCVASNKPIVLIAPVVGMQQTPFDSLRTDAPHASAEQFFDDANEALTRLRDGALEPDRFYVGSLPARPGRFVAHLDQLTPFKLPPETELKAWLQEHRAARLEPDFSRALTVRIFSSLARVGFDDFDWYGDEDLELLVTAGREAVARLSSSIATRNTNRAVLTARAKNDVESKEDTKKYNAEVAKHAQMTERLAPLEAELAKRLNAASVETLLRPVTQAATNASSPSKNDKS